MKTRDDGAREELAAAARVAVSGGAEALVVGEMVLVRDVRVEGRGAGELRAICERKGRTFVVGLADVVFPKGSAGAGLVARYREMLGLGGGDTVGRTGDVAAQEGGAGAAEMGAQGGADGIVVGKPTELVVLACKDKALRCRVLDGGGEVTLRMRPRDAYPGAVLVVTPTKRWVYARHVYVTGEFKGIRLDVARLGLTPLGLQEFGEWDPSDEEWQEEGEEPADWAKEILAAGKRLMYEMEQVVPGRDPRDPDSDPIVEAAELKDAGDARGARRLLMSLTGEDLRCLDAHAHLGNLEFDRNPDSARRHYEVGMRIGELTLGPNFSGALPWSLIDNRPYLRCLHGFALCAWRLGNFAEAKALMRRQLLLNPHDNQGARFNLADVAARKPWPPD